MTTKLTHKQKWIEKIVFVIIALAIIPASMAANNPGHDSLYIEEIGNSSITGSLNISNDLRVNNLTQPGALSIYGDGTQPGSGTYIASASGGNDWLRIDTPGILQLKYLGGDQILVGSTSTATDLNVTGTIWQGDVKVCLANGTNCINGNNSGNVSSILAGNGISVNQPTGAVTISINAATCTSNQYSYWDGDSWECRADQNSGGSSGSGWTNSSTQVYLSDANDDLNVSDTLFVDSSEGRVGIGTTTPSVTFQIDNEAANNDTEETVVIINASTSEGGGEEGLGAFVSFYGETNNGSSVEQGKLGYEWTVAADGPSGTDATNNAARFMVYGERRQYDEMFPLFSAYATGADRFFCMNDANTSTPDCFGMTIGSANAIAFFFDGTADASIQLENDDIEFFSDGHQIGIVTQQDDAIYFDEDNDGYDMYIKDGQVGIGTDNPNGTLHVIGTINASSDVCLHDGTCLSNAGSGSGNITGAGIANHIAYWSADDDILADNGQLYWDASSNYLGIGTNSPTHPLTVNGAANITSTANPGLILGNTVTGYLQIGGSVISDANNNLYLDSDTAQTVIADDLQVNGNDIKDSSSTTRITLGATNQVTGNLGINTASPGGSLGIGAIDNEAAATAFNITDEDGNQYFIVRSQGGGATDPGIVSLAGSLGIGTQSPDDFLEIDGALDGNGIHLDSSNAVKVAIDRGANTDNILLSFQTAGSNEWEIGNKGAGNANLEFYAGGSSTPSITVESTGNTTIAGNVTVSGANNGIELPGGGRVCGNSTTLILASPGSGACG